MQRTLNCSPLPWQSRRNYLKTAHEKFNYEKIQFNALQNITSILIPASFVPKLIALHFACSNQRTNERVENNQYL